MVDVTTRTKFFIVSLIRMGDYGASALSDPLTL
jgi:hypothetical protein